MALIDILKPLIKRHEGLRLSPYKCSAGSWSIGYGHNLDVRGEEIPAIITLEDAEAMLDRDIEDAYRSVRHIVWNFSELNEARQAVLIDMAFNMGPGGLITFVRFLDAVYHEQWQRASEEMLDSQWARQVGKRARELAEIFRTGEVKHE